MTYVWHMVFKPFLQVFTCCMLSLSPPVFKKVASLFDHFHNFMAHRIFLCMNIWPCNVPLLWEKKRKNIYSRCMDYYLLNVGFFFFTGWLKTHYLSITQISEQRLHCLLNTADLLISDYPAVRGHLSAGDRHSPAAARPGWVSLVGKPVLWPFFWLCVHCFDVNVPRVLRGDPVAGPQSDVSAGFSSDVAAPPSGLWGLPTRRIWLFHR